MIDRFTAATAKVENSRGLLLTSNESTRHGAKPMHYANGKEKEK
jgi:hypothetical protein